MGANASRQQQPYGYGYGYGYGPPPPTRYGGPYNDMYTSMPRYGKSRRRGTYAQYYMQPPPPGYPGGVLPMAAYPAMYPQFVAQPQLYYPYYTQPMQQVPGQTILPQAGVQPTNISQPPVMSQPAVQMPEPQVQPEGPPPLAPGVASGPAPGPFFGPRTGPTPGPMPMPTPGIGVSQPPGQGPFPVPLAGGGPAPPMNMPEPEIPVSGPSLAPPMPGGPGGPVIPGASPGIMPTPRPSADYSNPPPMNGVPGVMSGNITGTMPMPEPAIGPTMPGPGGFTSPPDGDFPSSTTASDPLDRNPLPTPPREFPIPDQLLADSAMTTRGVRMPAPTSEDYPPLRNPLPKLPKDVYNSRRYRELTIGNASHHQDSRRVYPSGWFDREGGGRTMPNLGRTLTGTFAKLNPFKPHQSRPGLHRRYNTMPVPTVPGAPGIGPEGEFSAEADDLDISSEEEVPTNDRYTMSRTLRRPFQRHRTFRFGRNPEQTSGFMAMPQASVPGRDSVGPQSMYPFSPNQQGSPIKFDNNSPQYGVFSLTSPHSVLYKDKIYPTALHLFEAHKFLKTRRNVAEQIKSINDLEELNDYVSQHRSYVRQDWERVLLDKLEDVLYLKFTQHRSLRDALFSTGLAELIFSDFDEFLGEGSSGQGRNELGKALMRVRERLRQEGAGMRY